MPVISIICAEVATAILTIAIEAVHRLTYAVEASSRPYAPDLCEAAVTEALV